MTALPLLSPDRKVDRTITQEVLNNIYSGVIYISFLRADEREQLALSLECSEICNDDMDKALFRYIAAFIRCNY